MSNFWDNLDKENKDIVPFQKEPLEEAPEAEIKEVDENAQDHEPGKSPEADETISFGEGEIKDIDEPVFEFEEVDEAAEKKKRNTKIYVALGVCALIWAFMLFGGKDEQVTPASQSSGPLVETNKKVVVNPKPVVTQQENFEVANPIVPLDEDKIQRKYVAIQSQAESLSQTPPSKGEFAKAQDLLNQAVIAIASKELPESSRQDPEKILDFVLEKTKAKKDQFSVSAGDKVSVTFEFSKILTISQAVPNQPLAEGALLEYLN